MDIQGESKATLHYTATLQTLTNELMFRLVYSILFAICMPFVFLRLIWRGYKAPEYRPRKLERFGIFRAPDQHKSIWVHAVSVGEVLAAEPIIREIQVRYPDRGIVITSMTPTSSALISRLFGDSVFHVYAPYDLAFLVRGFLKRVKPEFLMIMETELWPNMIHQARRFSCPVVLVNARLSERSAVGYRRLKPAVGWMLNELSLVLCQYKNDASRFASLGIAANKIHVTGSVKYDIELDPGLQQTGVELRSKLADEQRVWVAASTHEGEDEILLAVHHAVKGLIPGAVLLLVPRHPERFDAAVKLARQHEFVVHRRTQNPVIPADTEVFVVDTMGELMAFYAASDVAFIGGSFVGVGGHNPIEPAALGVPILMGPHVFNFEAICAQMASVGALEIVSDGQALTESLCSLMQHPERVTERGKAALSEVQAGRGAVQRVVDYLAPILDNPR